MQTTSDCSAGGPGIESLKVAIVGCGNIADSHAEQIKMIPRARLVACCDAESLMAEQLAVRFQIDRHYGEYAAMLEAERPDVVHITTPPQSHFQLAMTAMEKGCHVYVEKPLTVNSADARTLIETAVARNRKLTVGYTYHFDPPANLLRRMVSEGHIGDLVHVESFYGYNLDGSFGRAIISNPTHWVHLLPGKLFHNNLDHAISKVLDFSGNSDLDVIAVAFPRGKYDFGDIRDELLDELRVTLKGESVSAYVTFSSHVKPLAHFLRLYGTRNTVHANYITRTVTMERAPRLPSVIGRIFPPFLQGWDFTKAGGKNVFRFLRSDFHFFAGLNQLISRFYACILSDASPPIAYPLILKTTETMERVFELVENRSKQKDPA